MLVLGAVGAVVAVRRPTLLRVFLIWDFVLSLAVYCWADERFTWLVMHPLLPLILLAGLGVQAIWDARGGRRGRLGLAATAVCAAAMVATSWWANVENGADPREFLVTTQSSDAVKDVRDRVEAAVARARAAGREPEIVVDAAEGATFPWAWYFRDLPAQYPDLSSSEPPADADAVIVTEGNRAALAGALAGLRRARVPVPRLVGARLRRDVAAAWWRWFTRREPWNPTGGMPEWLYERPG